MSSNAEQSAGTSLSRRRFIQAAGAGAAVAALPAGASAQDGNETDDGSTPGTNISFPENTITTEEQGGSHRVLTEALGDAEIYQATPLSAATGGLVGGESTGVPALIQESLLMVERSGQNDENLLSQLYNMMNRARNFGLTRGTAVMIDQINNGGSEQQTIDGAVAEVDAQYTLIASNFLNCYKTRVNRINDQQNKLEDAGSTEAFSQGLYFDNNGGNYTLDTVNQDPGYTFGSSDVTLPDGTTTTTPRLKISGVLVDQDGGYSHTHPYEAGVDPTGVSTIVYNDDGSSEADVWTLDRFGFKAQTVDADPSVSSAWAFVDRQAPTTKSAFDSSSTAWTDLDLLNRWMILWDWINQQYQDVRSEIESYASESYQAVEAGEISVHDLVTNHPAVMASEWSTDYGETGHYSFAAASLGAMGVSYDYEHEMVVQLEDGSTLRGTLYVNADDFSFSVGETINPNGVPGSIWFAYSVDSARRELEPTGDYRTAVEGGQVLLRNEPTNGAEYLIETAAGERATIQASDFEPVDPAAVYNPDYSTNWKAVANLDQGNTEITSMTVRRADSTGDNIIEITQPFTIQEAYNVNNGDSVDEVTGENRTWQTTDVQLTQEQLEAMAEYYEEHQNYWERTSGGGGGGGGGFDLPGVGGAGLPDWINARNAAIAILAILGVNAATS